MRTVARHDFDAPNAERAVKRLSARRHEAREDIETDVLGPGFALERSYNEFASRCGADPRAADNETWLAFARALQGGGALFLTATRREGEEVEFRYDEDVIRRPATGPTQDSDAMNWLKTAYLAIVARDRARLELLAAVPVDLLRESGPQYDEFVFDWVRALQSHVRGNGDLIETVLAAMRGTEPEALRGSTPEAVLQLYFPPIELFYLFTQREDGKFADALFTALELHKQYWTADPERPRDTTSIVALAPLAMACLAHDAGMAFDVESDYLPHHLLVGTRVGEITI
ncbi:immunity 49 family protein [Amycolatopsis cynarae]|uniref:Immunity 49 family protein n=1 Tax=Amycolatopsis cynarae TaxID=2995223 RepID=A0ABY7AUE1_9PSEU|nr:immunity 49 family protein [Amycolatopsis sp. HUAS 11-8]WAL63531.1 immunity 49 family protein [Amycolatopsis sp. HUAS 11-8]